MRQIHTIYCSIYTTLKERKGSTSSPKLCAPQRNNIVLYCVLSLDKLQELGKEYPWVKPLKCPSCGGRRLWGHGYVYRYFQEVSIGLWMKRWYCPECGQVHTLRPNGYQSRILHSLETIRTSLLHKLQRGFFKTVGASRQVQQYWWKQLKRWIHSRTLQRDCLVIEEHIRSSYHLPVSTSVRLRVISYAVDEEQPYLPFALSTTVPFD